MSEPSKNLYISLGVAVWVSFLMAGVATMLFFATFDPVALAAIATFPLSLDQMAGYSIGFLLFWFLLLLNSLAVIWLVKHPPK